MTRAAFARLLGCAKPRVTEWVNQSVITGAALALDGRVIPSVAVAQLHAAGRFASGAAAAIAPAGMRYDDARAAREALKAHSALLDLRARRGELIEASVAEGVLFEAMRGVRDAWATWPARVAAEMAARLRVDQATLMLELEAAVRRQLMALADPKSDWRRQASTRAGAA